MKHRHVAIGLCTLLLVGLAVSSFAQAADEERVKRAEKAKQIAVAYFDALIQGNTAVSTSLSAVPFAWDGKETIESLPELEKGYEAIVADKGKRQIKATKVEIAAGKREIADDVFPDDRIVVRVWIDDEAIAICVRPGDAYKVVGFRD